MYCIIYAKARNVFCRPHEHLPEVVGIAKRALEHVVNPTGEMAHAGVHARHVFLPTTNAPRHDTSLHINGLFLKLRKEKK
jgi:hypothetical protein